MVSGEIGKIFVGIPAYNEEENIGAVLNDWSNLSEVYQILVVDDGSVDKTREIALKRPEVFLHCHPQNRGIAAAQRTLMCLFLDISDQPNDVFVLVHADGAMYFGDLGLFITCFKEKNPDVILGSRLLRWHQNLKPRGWFCTFSDMFLILLENLAFRTWLTSYGSGFRAWKRSAIERLHLDEVISIGTSFDVEIVARTVIAGLKICEIPIKAKPKLRSSSYLLTRYARDTLKIVTLYGFWRWTGIRPPSLR